MTVRDERLNIFPNGGLVPKRNINDFYPAIGSQPFNQIFMILNRKYHQKWQFL